MFKVEFDAATNGTTGKPGYFYRVEDVAGRQCAGFEETPDALADAIAAAVRLSLAKLGT
jgi:hypothetical protein